ncbi:uncharacterized protein LOC112556910 [Pomacea canaliculata]|uniref:uncharacterized protein LOC112556910 n=1 Tax=Pomacea canaliculata TaxID=400727 RepID=UPI000D734051|nr:uncharacterized protein LOC112556910 [Pomacea canaliculata]
MDLEDRRPDVFFYQRDSYFTGLDIYQNELFVTNWGPEKHLSETTYIYRIGKSRTMLASVQVNGRVNEVRVYAEESIHTASTPPAPTSDHTIESGSTETDSDGTETLNIILVGVIVALVVTTGITILIVIIKKRKCK